MPFLKCMTVLKDMIVYDQKKLDKNIIKKNIMDKKMTEQTKQDMMMISLLA